MKTPEIELRLFRYFVALCDEQSFAGAAERLEISPPTMTMQIKKLEADLGIDLLDRSQRRVLRLTEAGKRFAENARNVLHHVEQTHLATLSAGRGRIGRVDIGFVITAAYNDLISRYIGKFQRQFPAVDVVLSESSTVNLMTGIIDRRLDAGFARAPRNLPSELSAIHVHRSPVVLAIPKDNPLAQQSGPIHPKQLRDESFVSTSVSYDLAFDRTIEMIASRGEFAPRISKRAEHINTVLAYVSAGCGIAAVSIDFIGCQMSDIVYKKIAGCAPPVIDYLFFYRKNETSPPAKALAEFMASQKLPAFLNSGIAANVS